MADAYISQLAHLLRDRVDEMAELMVARIRSDVAAAHGDLHPEVGADQEELIQRMTRGIVDSWVERRPLSYDELRSARAAGERGARQGVSFAAMHKGIAIAGSVGLAEITALVREIEPSGALDALRVMGGDLFRLVHQVLTAMTDGYLEARTSIPHDSVGGALVQMLTGAFDDANRMDEMARLVGVDVAAPHALILLTSVEGRGSPALLALASAVARELHGLVVTGLAESTHLTVVASAGGGGWSASRPALEAMTRTAGAVALCTTAAEGSAALHAAYDRATGLLHLVPQLAAPGSVFDTDDLDVYRVIEMIPASERDAYIGAVFGPILALTRKRAETLLATLVAITQAHGRAEVAARNLGCSRQAVRIRVEQLDRLLDMQCTDVNDHLVVGLLALRLSRHGHLFRQAVLTGAGAPGSEGIGRGRHWHTDDDPDASERRRHTRAIAPTARR